MWKAKYAIVQFKIRHLTISDLTLNSNLRNFATPFWKDSGEDIYCFWIESPEFWNINCLDNIFIFMRQVKITCISQAYKLVFAICDCPLTAYLNFEFKKKEKKKI